MTTTVKIKKETKEKLDLFKGEQHISYNDLICILLKQIGGMNVDDVLNIKRNPVAFKLECYQTETMENWVEREITYRDLRENPVGTVFKACEESPRSNFVNATSEIIEKRGDDVILWNKQIFYDSNGNMEIKNEIVHFNIF